MASCHALAQLFPIHAAVGAEVLGQVDRAQAAVLVGSKPLLAAGVGGFQLVEVRHRVGAVGGIQEEHARLAVVVRLVDDLLEQVAGAHGLVDLEAGCRRLRPVRACRRSRGSAGRVTSGKRRSQSASSSTALHEGIGDADGDVEIGDLVLVGLAGDEFFHIRMIHAQDGHVGAAAGAALGDLAKGMVVDAQEADRPGGLPGGGFDQAALGAQAREGEAVAAAGLLDEGGIAQGLEDAGGVAAHVIA